MSDKIKAALAALDPAKDEHWTSDGLPRLDVLKEILQMEVSRADIQAVSKTFSRKNLIIEDEKLPGEMEDSSAVNQPTVEGSGAVVTPPEDIERDDYEQAVKVEYERASQNLIAAQRRFKEAQSRMDEIISAKEREQKQITFADTVKQFQDSQRRQREARVGVSKALAEAVKTNQALGKV